MRIGRRARVVAISMVLGVCAAALARCSSRPAGAPPPTPDAAAASLELTPVLSVKEVMEHIIDPTADWIFDAAVIEVSAQGIVETAPTSDDDWLRIERGALLLAESANLLKIPRPMAPPGTTAPIVVPGEPSPELSPEQIQAKVDRDRALWYKHADGLRRVALESLPVIRARQTDKLFDIGDALDKACESCHLEYWYPGDKKFVQDDQKKTITFAKP